MKPRILYVPNLMQLSENNRFFSFALDSEHVKLRRLRTFAPKSSYGEIFFISRLELGHKVLTPKMKKKKNGGHRLCFGENGSGKMP